MATYKWKDEKTKIDKEKQCETEGKTMKHFNKDEQNLLMYFESQIVDNDGEVAGARMNEDDFGIAKKWNKEGFISFERIPFHDINKNKAISDTHQVKFSDEAWMLAHQFRRERGERHVETIKVKGQAKND